MNNRRRRIRSHVAAGTVSVFLALFGGIYAQQSASDDTASTAVASTATTTQSRTTTTVTPVTTRQS